jgi:hypothetical protein
MYENEKDKISKRVAAATKPLQNFLMFLRQSQGNKRCVSDKTLRYNKPIQASRINVMLLISEYIGKVLKTAVYVSPGMTIERQKFYKKITVSRESKFS